MRALVFLLLAGACTPVPVFALGGDLAEEQIDRAVELGLPVYHSEDRSAEILVVVVDDLDAVAPEGVRPGAIEGYAVARYLCRRIVFITPDSGRNTAAHEIGHLLGLAHTDDDANLMHHSGEGDELTDKQVDKVERVADRLAMCRNGHTK